METTKPNHWGAKQILDRLDLESERQVYWMHERQLIPTTKVGNKILLTEANAQKIENGEA